MLKPNALLSATIDAYGAKNIVKDAQGNLWLGTARGLVRYNGYDRIEKIDTVANDVNWVTALVVNKRNQLIVGTEQNGVLVYDAYKYEKPPVIHPLNAEIKDIYLNSFDEPVIATDKGYYNLYTKDSGLKKYELTSIVQTNQNTLYAGSKSGLFKVTNGKESLLNNKPVKRLKLFGGSVWGVTYKSELLNLAENNTASIILSDVENIFKHHSNQNVFWVITIDGYLKLFDITRKVYIEHNFKQYFSSLYNLFHDNAGIWGADRQKVKLYREGILDHQEEKSFSFGNTAFGFLNETDVFVAKHGVGIYKGKFSSSGKIENTSLFLSLEDAYVTKMITDNDILWMSTSKGVRRVNLADNTSKYILPNMWIISINLYHDKVYINTDSKGLVIIDKKGQIIRIIDSKMGLPTDEVLFSLPTTDNKVWIATSKGIGVFNSKNNSVKVLHAQSTSRSKFTSIVEVSGKVYLATLSNGIFIFDMESLKQVGHLTISDGLISNESYNIWKNKDFIWTIGELGLNRIDQRTYAIDSKFFSERYTKNSYINKVDDKVFWLCKERLNKFCLRSFDMSAGFIKTPLKISLNQVILNNSHQLITKKYYLPHSYGHLQFLFLANDYGGSSFETFQNNQWKKLRGNMLSFSQLEPGNYEFYVRAIKNNETSEPIAIHIEVASSKIRLAVFVIIGLVIIFAFLWTNTKRKQMKKEKLTSEKHSDERELLLANISHEIRTPLTLIAGRAEHIAKGIRSENTQEYAGVIKTHTARILNMINQLMDVSRVRSGKAEKSLVNIQSVVEFIVNSYLPILEERGIYFEYQYKPDRVLFANLIPDALEKICTNLISNAIKYGNNEIIITLEENQKKQMMLKISDNGMGISEINHELIFEYFTRLTNATDVESGSGIGLALTRFLVEANDGEISVASKLGVGTEFQVLLPVLAEGVEKTDTQSPVLYESEAMAVLSEFNNSASTCDLSSGTKAVALVIDDHSEMRNYIADCLNKEYLVLQAENGELGIALAIDRDPDIIICDVMMPVMSGFEVSDKLKKDDRTSHIPLILLTAKSDKCSRLSGWKSQVDGYLTKPFDEEELLLRISSLLAIRSVLRQRFGEMLKSNNGDELKKLKKELSPKDSLFFDKLNQTIEANYSEENFSVSDMAAQINISERQLRRKVKALFNYSPSEYLKVYRLNKAKELLEKGYMVKIVTFEVGFSSVSYFSSCFKIQFGKTPKQIKDITDEIICT